MSQCSSLTFGKGLICGGRVPRASSSYPSTGEPELWAFCEPSALPAQGSSHLPFSQCLLSLEAQFKFSDFSSVTPKMLK